MARRFRCCRSARANQMQAGLPKAPDKNRTCNLLITRQLLCQLSYRSMFRRFACSAFPEYISIIPQYVRIANTKTTIYSVWNVNKLRHAPYIVVAY